MSAVPEAINPAPTPAVGPDAPEGTVATTIDLSTVRWSGFASDGRRALIAFVTSVAVPFVVINAVHLFDPSWDHGVPFHVVTWLVGWNLFTVLYVLMTTLTFRGHDAATFQALMDARRARRNKVWRTIDGPDRGGPIFAIQSAVIAFAVVLVLPRIDAIRVDDLVLVPITLTILLSSWGISVVSYALHYAQHDLAEPSLDFPGERTQAWADYVYFSMAVATTFGATDVNITTPSMRRVVNAHVVLTFVYNSVIVALLASLLLR